MAKFYVTTPIYYVNAKPHLGGAYTTLAADVLARWHRMKGEKTFFLTGTDEHGEKITQTAKEKKLTPKQLCDQNAAKYEQVWDTFRISYDKFIRTTNPEHEKIVTDVLQKLYDKKLIYKGTYQGLYCVDCERYYTGKELIDGRCQIHRKKAITLTEECYFFKLSAFQQQLLKLITGNELVIEPTERRNEVLGFLKNEKLEDLAISREKVTWGIPIPWDNSQTIYVWIDALINYLSGINWRVGTKKYPKEWPPDIQLIGKDILRFHAIIWPAMLLSLKLPLPKKIYAHGFFTIGGEKMSKSLGNVIDPEELAVTFGADALRWIMLSIFPFGQDGDVSQSKFYDKYNTNLANGLGNLHRRILTLAEKSDRFFPPKEVNNEFKKEIETVWEKYENALDQLKFEVALAGVNNLISFCDKYINREEPWRLFKKDVAEYQKVLYNLLEGLRHLGWLIQPFMPEKSNQIFASLGLLGQEKKKSLTEGKKWAESKFKKIIPGDILFPRL